MQVKVLTIVGQTIMRNGVTVKTLAENIEQSINKTVAEIENAGGTISKVDVIPDFPSLAGGGSAFVIVNYVPGASKKAVPHFDDSEVEKSSKKKPAAWK